MITTVDWSPFANTLTARAADAIALVGVLVGGAITIALVFAEARAVIRWSMHWIGEGSYRGLDPDFDNFMDRAEDHAILHDKHYWD